MWVFSFTTLLIVYSSVNSYGVVGSIDNTEGDCSICQKTKCRPVSGIYTAPGAVETYALIAQLPQYACKVLVQQMRPTRNFLALKQSDGQFALNGDWKTSNSRSFEIQGVRFTYLKQDNNTFESITTSGPLLEPIDLMIGHYQADSAIKYQYNIPWDLPKIAPPLLKRPFDLDGGASKRLDANSLNSLSQKDEAVRPVHSYHRRQRVRRKFVWKITGLSPCTKTCGGGTQTPLLTCMRELTLTPVIDRRCSHLDKPQVHLVQCNTINCPPIGRWTGYWSDCSVTCGEGVEQYVFECREDLGNGRSVVVNAEDCPKRPTAETRTCNRAPCDSENEVPNTDDPGYKSGHKEWTVGHWTECTVTCGTGHRTRSVTCPSGQCNPRERPLHAEYCNLGDCYESPKPHHQEPNNVVSSNWLLTEWSQCSEICGTGTQTRLALCPDGTCRPETKPELSRACSSERKCNGEWFAGPWGSCTDSCQDQARQKRDVFCIVKIRGHPHITNDMTCSSSSKPITEQACDGTCPAQWFTGDWGQCEGCPGGTQRRKVVCLEANGSSADYCTDDDVPIGKRPCVCSRKVEEPREPKDHREKYRPAQQDEPIDRSCVDKIRTCHQAVQARLCQYQYYAGHCCASCKRAQPELLL